MKKIVILLALIGVYSAFAQNHGPSKALFGLDTTWSNVQVIDTMEVSTDIDYFKIKNMILGWQWGGDAKISRAVFSNQRDTKPPSWLSDCGKYISNMNGFVRMSGYTHCKDADLMNIRGLQYEPELSYDTNPWETNIRANDTARGIFPFRHKLGVVPTNSNDENYYRLVIDGTNINDLKDSVILSDPWPDNRLYV